MLNITKDFSYIIKIISLLAELLINALRLSIFHELTGLKDHIDLDSPSFDKELDIIEIQIIEDNEIISTQNNFSLLFDFDLLINNFDLKAIYLSSSTNGYTNAVTFQDILNNKYTFIATLKKTLHPNPSNSNQV